MQFSGSLVNVPELMCKFLTERQKSSCFISKYGLACPSAPKSKDYALELVDGQENKLPAKNWQARVNVWGQPQEALVKYVCFSGFSLPFLQDHVL